MQAGKLRRRITIERPTTGAQSATGEPTLAWATLTTCWAEIRPLSGRELFAARQVQSDVSHSIRIRANAETTTITSRDRVKFGERTFQITGVTNTDERNKEITLACTERKEP